MANNKQLENRNKCSLNFLYKSSWIFVLQHLSWILAITMNAFITLTLVAAAASACPEMTHMECGTEEMLCPGGMDSEGCPMPDMCMPMMGEMN